MSRMRWSDLNFERISKELPPAEQPNSDLHQMWGTLNALEKSYTPFEGYNQSKVANVLFGIGVTRMLYANYGILGVSLYPGVILTELSWNASSDMRAQIDKTLEQGIFEYKTLGAGSSTTMVAALDPNLAMDSGESKDETENYGSFLDNCQISERHKAGRIEL